MIDAILIQKSVKFKIGVKTLISVCLIAAAVILPQLVHLAVGVSGGVMFLPMYLPVLVAGCLLGWKFGLGVGILSPLVSFCLTAAFGNPMPALARLPFMIAELAVFASISGIFSRKIANNVALAFPAVIAAAVAGRLTFVALAAIFESVSSLSLSLVWSQVQTGMIGLVLQFVIVPLIIIALSKLIKKEEANE